MEDIHGIDIYGLDEEHYIDQLVDQLDGNGFDIDDYTWHRVKDWGQVVVIGTLGDAVDAANFIRDWGRNMYPPIEVEIGLPF
jgi:hypothetical protein